MQAQQAGGMVRRHAVAEAPAPCQHVRPRLPVHRDRRGDIEEITVLQEPEGLLHDRLAIGEFVVHSQPVRGRLGREQGLVDVRGRRLFLKRQREREPCLRAPKPR